MNELPVNVLEMMVQRLPLQQKFQTLCISKKFEEASSLALKQHQSLGTVLENGYKTSQTKCNVASWTEHRIRDSDMIGQKWFSSKKTRKNILKRLPRLKTIAVHYFGKKGLSDLSLYCPELECLTDHDESLTEKLFKEPNLLHFKGDLCQDGLNELINCYPCLTHLSCSSSDVLDVSGCFREGIQALDLNWKDQPKWDTLFLASAMKTVERLAMGVVEIEDLTNFSFVAPKLKELDVAIHRFDCDDDDVLSVFESLRESLSFSPELQSLKLEFEGSSLPMPPSLFDSTSQLLCVSLPRVSRTNTGEVLEVICERNPLLKELCIGQVSGSNEYKKKILDLISSLTQLKSLTIRNRSLTEVLTTAELEEFVTRNTVNDTLRFCMELHQEENFPQEDSDESMFASTVWRGIHWFNY